MADQRVIVLLDMDCFYVQCEQRLQPDKWGKPCAVAQYNWNERTGAGGGLIAVNYEARAFGVKRGMRVPEVLKLCPNCHVFRVPEKNGKADLKRYREASKEVFDTIVEFIAQEEQDYSSKDMIILERASVDEAYLDLTKLIDSKFLRLPSYDQLDQYNTKLEMNTISLFTWILNENSMSNDDVRLTMGALLIGKLRKMILEKTQFRCSAGISHNKMLAKLACGINKPNAQTILPIFGVNIFLENINITDVRFLGGKVGRELCEALNIKTMRQLKLCEEHTLAALLNDQRTAKWLYNLARGIDSERVVDRRLSKSLGCGKNFPGKNKLSKHEEIFHWTKVLCHELHTRLLDDYTNNHRLAKLIVVGYYTAEGQCSKSVAITVIGNQYPESEKLAKDIMKAVFPDLTPSTTFGPIHHLSLSATKFVPESNQSSTMHTYFSKIDREVHIEKNQEVSEPKDKPKTVAAIGNLIERYFNPMNQEDENSPANRNILTFDNKMDEEDDYNVEENIYQIELDIIKKSYLFQEILDQLEKCEEKKNQSDNDNVDEFNESEDDDLKYDEMSIES